MATEAIALIDCNNFYASCERLFDRTLHNKPIVVLSNNDGCVIARSNEAKRIGVAMGAPLFQIETFLDQHEAAIFSSNYELYGDLSQRVMENLYEFTPDVEIYSIDEAFLGLPPLKLSEGKKSFDFIGREIQAKINKWTGIPVSIGIAETKVLAKLANRIAKKSEKAGGVLDLFGSKHQTLALSQTPIADVWGIGAASAEKLRANEIFSALELRDADRRFVRSLLTVTGARIVTELRGVRALPLETNAPPKQSITCSRTFGRSVTELKHLREAVAVYLARATEKMRRHNLAANSVTVFIATDRFAAEPNYYSNSATYSSAYLTDINQELQSWAFSCLERIYRAGFAYRKAGVILNGLTPADRLTARLYDDERWERFRQAMRAMDDINRRFGRDTIRFGTARDTGEWSGRANRRSGRYTTRTAEIKTIK